jgi:hypothetical protein
MAMVLALLNRPDEILAFQLELMALSRVFATASSNIVTCGLPERGQQLASALISALVGRHKILPA